MRPLLKLLQANSLRTRILLFVLLLFIPSFGLIVWTANDQRESDRQAASTRARLLTRIAATEHEALIDSTHRLLITLANLPEVQPDPASTQQMQQAIKPILQTTGQWQVGQAACNALFSELLTVYGNYTNLFAVNMQGDTLCTGLGMQHNINVMPLQFEWFHATRETQDFAVGDYRIGVRSGLPVITMSYPVYDEHGEMSAVVAAALSLNWLNDYLQEAPLPEGAVLTIIDRNGTVLARYPQTDNLIGQQYPVEAVRRAALSPQYNSDTLAHEGIDGETRLYGYTALGSEAGGISIIMGLPESVALAEAEAVENRNLLALGGMTLLVIVLAWFGSGLLLRPLMDLSTASQALTAGDLSSRVRLTSHIKEFKQLIIAFNSMAQSVEKQVHRRTAELSTTNERLRIEVEERRDAQHRTHVLQELTAALSEAITYQQVAHTIISQGLIALGGSIATIAIKRPHQDRYELIANMNLHEDLALAYHEIDPDDEVPLAIVIRTGEPIWIENKEAYAQYYPRTYQHSLDYQTNTSAFAILPLTMNKEVIGSLGVAYTDPMLFTPEQRSLMLTIAEYCSQALERARLYEDEREARSSAEAARKRFAFLAEVSAILAKSLDVQVTLEQLVNLVVPDLADWCLVDLHLQGGESARVAVAHIDPDKVELLQRLTQTYTHAEQKEQMKVVTDTSHDGDDDNLKLIRQLNVRSYMSVPLRVRGRTLGTLAFGTSDSGRDYQDTDLVLVEELAQRAALAVENAELYSTEHRARQSAEWTTERIARLQKATASLSQSLTAPQVAEVALEQMITSLNANAGAIALFDPETNILSLLHSIGYAPEIVQPWGAVPIDDHPMLTEAIIGGKTLWLEAIADGPLPFVADTHRSVALLPLAIEARKMGIISLCFDDQRLFADEDRTFTVALMQNCAQALERAILSEEAQKVAALEERNRLARDLHDAVTQTLFSSSVISEALTRMKENRPNDIWEQLDRLHRLNRGALAEMRNLLLELRPTRLTEVSMKELLEQMVHAAMGRGDLVIAVDVQATIKLPPDVQVAFYRIAQEALNNVMKHARSEQASVTFTATADQVRLVICDQGAGFDVQAHLTAGMGMSTMRERAEAIGADFQIESQSGQGTTISLTWIPAPEAILSTSR